MNDEDIANKVETNVETLLKRSKCIRYGKNTDEYKSYVESIPK